MNVSFVFEVEKTAMDAEAGYARLGRLLAALKPVLAVPAWYLAPTDAKESKQFWPQYTGKAAFMRKVQDRLDQALSEWPEYAGGFSALLTSASDEASFKQATGRASLTFAPARGRIQLQIVKPDEAWSDLDLMAWAKGILCAVVIEEWVIFANTDVAQRPRADGQQGADYFSQDYRTFPHRQYLGWMGYIQRLPPKTLLKPEDIPQAAQVIPMPGRVGTLIVSVGEKFDVHNPYHIMQAQQVEMRLVDLDALPVIDPSFK